MKILGGICFVAVVLCILVTISKLNYEVSSLNKKLISRDKLIRNKEDIITELKKRPQLLKSGMMTVTGYSPTKSQCDDSPLITAFMTKVKHGTVAVSRDLVKAGWRPGMKVYIEGLGVFVINDLMNKRYTKSIDVFCWKTKDALKLARNKCLVTLIDEG